MKKTMLFLLLAVCTMQVQACSNKAVELKSPCVGAENSPCGPKRAANPWMA